MFKHDDDGNKVVDWKAVIVSILVGAATAFLTALIEGIQDAANGYLNNSAGAIAAAAKYYFRHIV